METGGWKLADGNNETKIFLGSFWRRKTSEMGWTQVLL